ncbi:hypothetical protein AYO38_02315 [bacterium SCGC AG-212-C10]|nr:hypothetical protein AYO38_02315 [bacterium SCGC AG-212-C10]
MTLLGSCAAIIVAPARVSGESNLPLPYRIFAPAVVRSDPPDYSVESLESLISAWRVPRCELKSQALPCEQSGISYGISPATGAWAQGAEGSAILFSLYNGPSYGNVMFARTLFDNATQEAASSARIYTLNLRFKYSPETTANNHGGLSRLEQLEFAIHIRRQIQGSFRVANFELAYTNVFGNPSENQKWSISAGDEFAWSNVFDAARLTAETWHEISVRVEIIPGRIVDSMHYISATIDGETHKIDRYYTPVAESFFATSSISTHVQLDGSVATPSLGGFEVAVDQVNISAD